MTFPSNQNLYGIGIGSSNGSGPNNVHFDVRAPTSADVNFAVGTRWIFINNAEYVLVGQSSAGGVLISDWTLLGTTGGALNTITTQDSTVLIPVAGNINLVGTSPISTTGSGNTGTVALTGTVPVANGGTGLTAVTIHDLMIGNGTSPLTLLAPSATSGVPLISQGASSNPAYGTAVVAGGGTGATTLTAHGVLIGEGTGPFVATAAGTTGQVLTGVTGADPVWASPATNGTVTSVTGTANQINVATGTTTPVLTISSTLIAPGSIAATTTLTATLGNITATNGNLVLGTAGNKIVSTSVGTTTAAGANSFGSVTLVLGTATVATTAVTANSLIFLSRMSIGATGATPLGELTVGTISAGVSFIINAATTATASTVVTTDVSVVAYMIIN